MVMGFEPATVVHESDVLLTVSSAFLFTRDCAAVMITLYNLLASGLFGCFGCCPFLGGGYLFFYLQFIVTPDVFGDMCLVDVHTTFKIRTTAGKPSDALGQLSDILS